MRRTDEMELYCAIDIIDGGAVRLTRGEFDKRTEHGDPVELALRFVAAGACFLHVVDLDAARDGEPVNRGVVLEIVRRTGVRVQVGGGVRRSEDVDYLLEAGVERVVLGTAAVERPDIVDSLVERYPGRIALGIDYRIRLAEGGNLAEEPAQASAAGQHAGATGNFVALRGWKQDSSATVNSLLDRFAGAALGALVVTSIERDGAMSGPDTAGLVEVLARSSHPVIASGGVRSAADLAALAAVTVLPDGSPGPDESGPARRIAGAVVGRALADGSLDIREAIAACEQYG